MDLNSGLNKRSSFSKDNINNNNYEQKRRKQDTSNYGNGMSWVRGCMIGKGCFGSVYIASLKKPKLKYSSYPRIMAVKSAEVSVSGSIQKEKEVMDNIRGCPNVIKCFGEETTVGDNGQMVYNLLLEYGSGGTLADQIKNSGGKGLAELDVKRYTRSILRGLRYVHRCGYVHCDLKPENIMLVASSSVDDQLVAKIGDFGLAKRGKENKKGKLIVPCWRGTPMYFSPEVVIDGVQEAPSDIWAVGCIVLEMLTAKPPWGLKGDTNSDEIIARIGEVNESPLVPSTLSSEAKSFLKGCFSRKSMYRWTAEMLLAHPFLEGIDDDEDDNDDNNNNNVEDTGDVFDINAISSLIMSESDDDEAVSFSSFSDGLCSWSDEDVDGTETDVNSCYSVEEITSSTAPLNEVHQYPITFTIASGV